MGIVIKDVNYLKACFLNGVLEKNEAKKLGLSEADRQKLNSLFNNGGIKLGKTTISKETIANTKKYKVKGSKSGRYYIIKNGKKTYYSANGKPIKESYFWNKEGYVLKNGKPEKKVQEKGWWARTKEVGKAALNTVKSTVCDEKGNFSWKKAGETAAVVGAAAAVVVGVNALLVAAEAACAASVAMAWAVPILGFLHAHANAIIIGVFTAAIAGKAATGAYNMATATTEREAQAATKQMGDAAGEGILMTLFSGIGKVCAKLGVGKFGSKIVNAFKQYFSKGKPKAQPKARNSGSSAQSSDKAPSSNSSDNSNTKTGTNAEPKAENNVTFKQRYKTYRNYKKQVKNCQSQEEAANIRTQMNADVESGKLLSKPQKYLDKNLSKTTKNSGAAYDTAKETGTENTASKVNEPAPKSTPQEKSLDFAKEKNASPAQDEQALLNRWNEIQKAGREAAQKSHNPFKPEIECHAAPEVKFTQAQSQELTKIEMSLKELGYELDPYKRYSFNESPWVKKGTADSALKPGEAESNQAVSHKGNWGLKTEYEKNLTRIREIEKRLSTMPRKQRKNSKELKELKKLRARNTELNAEITGQPSSVEPKKPVESPKAEPKTDSNAEPKTEPNTEPKTETKFSFRQRYKTFNNYKKQIKDCKDPKELAEIRARIKADVKSGKLLERHKKSLDKIAPKYSKTLYKEHLHNVKKAKAPEEYRKTMDEAAKDVQDGKMSPEELRKLQAAAPQKIKKTIKNLKPEEDADGMWNIKADGLPNRKFSTKEQAEAYIKKFQETCLGESKTFGSKVAEKVQNISNKVEQHPSLTFGTVATRISNTDYTYVAPDFGAKVEEVAIPQPASAPTDEAEEANDTDSADTSDTNDAAETTEADNITSTDTGNNTENTDNTSTENLNSSNGDESSTSSDTSNGNSTTPSSSHSSSTSTSNTDSNSASTPVDEPSETPDDTDSTPANDSTQNSSEYTQDIPNESVSISTREINGVKCKIARVKDETGTHWYQVDPNNSGKMSTHELVVDKRRIFRKKKFYRTDDNLLKAREIDVKKVTINGDEVQIFNTKQDKSTKFVLIENNGICSKGPEVIKDKDGKWKYKNNPDL